MTRGSFVNTLPTSRIRQQLRLNYSDDGILVVGTDHRRLRKTDVSCTPPVCADVIKQHALKMLRDVWWSKLEIYIIKCSFFQHWR